MVQLRWRVALLCVLSLFLEHVGAGNSPSCGQCEKSQCRRRRQRCSERDRDRVLDACKCCKLCPIMEGETCGDYDRSMRVRCHPDLFCVPLNESTTIGVCHRRQTTPEDPCLSRPCRRGQQCMSQGRNFICTDLSCSPQRIYKGCHVDSDTKSCRCGQAKHCVNPFRYLTTDECQERRKGIDCSDVLCMNWSRSCPADSKPALTHSRVALSTCCELSIRGSCQCSVEYCKQFKTPCRYAGMKQVRVRTGSGTVPGLCCDVYDCVRDTRAECPRHLQCTPDIICPPDSERVTGLRHQNSCCPDPGYCECKPCVVECPEGYFPRLVENGSEVPGRCCPTYACQKDESYCSSDGMQVPGSTSWHPSPCKRCTCVQGLVTCSDIQCKTLESCPSYTLKGQCCPVCINNTMATKPPDHNDCKDSRGVTHKDGVEFWSRSNGTCTRCACMKGNPICSVKPMICSPVNCSNPTTPEGGCCLVCPLQTQCNHNGKIYQVGEKWRMKNRCRECECLENGKNYCDSVKCRPNNCSDGEAMGVQGQCCDACPEEIRRNRWTPCDCSGSGSCGPGQELRIIPGKCCLVCKDRGLCKRQRCQENYTCEEVGVNMFQTDCVPNRDSILPSLPLLIVTTSSSTTSASTEQNLSPFYVYLVVEMAYAEFIQPSYVFFASDFSQYLSPGLRNVQVIVLRHEAFNYGRLDTVKHQALERSRREVNGMTLVKVVVKDKNGHYIKATDVIAVIKENVRKFDENKQEFIVIRWFTEKQIAEEDIYGTMSPTGPVSDYSAIGYSDEQLRHDKDSIDLDSLALYVVAAIVGCICIAFLTIFIVSGIHKKLNKNKATHNTATRQTEQQTEEPEVLSESLADHEKSEEDFDSRVGCTATSHQDTAHANGGSVYSVLNRVLDEEPRRQSYSEAEAGSVHDSGSSDSIVSSNSVASGHEEAGASEPIQSPSPTPSQLLALTVVTGTNSAQSNVSEPDISTASQHYSVETEKISTPV